MASPDAGEDLAQFLVNNLTYVARDLIRAKVMGPTARAAESCTRVQTPVPTPVPTPGSPARSDASPASPDAPRLPAGKLVSDGTAIRFDFGRDEGARVARDHVVAAVREQGFDISPVTDPDSYAITVMDHDFGRAIDATSRAIDAAKVRQRAAQRAMGSASAKEGQGVADRTTEREDREGVDAVHRAERASIEDQGAADLSNGTEKDITRDDDRAAEVALDADRLSGRDVRMPPTRGRDPMDHESVREDCDRVTEVSLAQEGRDAKELARDTKAITIGERA